MQQWCVPSDVHRFTCPCLTTRTARLLWCRSARDALALSFQENKPRRRQVAAAPTHPLLGDAPTLQLMRTNTMGGYVAPSECAF